MKNKIFITFISIVSCFCICFLLNACDSRKEHENSTHENSTMENCDSGREYENLTMGNYNYWLNVSISQKLIPNNYKICTISGANSNVLYKDCKIFYYLHDTKNARPDTPKIEVNLNAGGSAVFEYEYATDYSYGPNSLYELVICDVSGKIYW